MFSKFANWLSEEREATIHADRLRRGAFRLLEERGGYTDAVINQIINQASGKTVGKPSQTAAARAASGLVARSMAIALVDPPMYRTTLNPRVLHQIGSSMALDGEDVYLIRISEAGDRVFLERASDWDIRDGRGGWRYRLTIPTPSTTRTVDVPAEQVLHPRFNQDKAHPEKGQGLLALPSHTSRILAALEQSLGDEVVAPTGNVLPAPLSSMGESDLADLKRDLKNLKGRTSIVPSMTAGWGDGRSGAPQDWRPNRIGANPPDVLKTLRDSTHDSVLGAMGVPAALFSARSDASAAREALRQFLHSTLQPVADLVLMEIHEKLDPNITLNFDRLMAADLQGKARAAKALVDAGFTMQEAAAMAGFIDRDGGNS